MTQYLPGFATETAALKRSADIASGVGCNQSKDDITKYWHDVKENTDQTEYALVIEDNNTGLTVSEQDRLKSQSQMTTAGWDFTKPTTII